MSQGTGSASYPRGMKQHRIRHGNPFSGCVCREFMGERTQKPVMERAYLRLVIALTWPKGLISWVHLSLKLNGRWFSGVDLETMGWFTERLTVRVSKFGHEVTAGWRWIRWMMSGNWLHDVACLPTWNLQQFSCFELVPLEDLAHWIISNLRVQSQILCKSECLKLFFLPPLLVLWLVPSVPFIFPFCW